MKKIHILYFRYITPSTITERQYLLQNWVDIQN
jgi:hypothetical protein